MSSDPALDISRQHQHEHTHHGGAAAAHTKDEPVYTHGTMPEDHQIPPQFSHKDIETEEKKGVPLTGDIEKGSRTGSGESVRSGGGGGGSSSDGVFKKYRVFVHAFIFCLFTG